MMLSKVDSVQQQQTSLSHDDVIQHDVQLRQGEFIGLVQYRGNKYSFLVRDVLRERPTIYGSGVDFPTAITAVSQLLDALENLTQVAPSDGDAGACMIEM